MYYIPGIVPGAKDTVVDKTDNYFHGADILLEVDK